MAEVVIFGTGKTAEVVHHRLARESDHRVVGFTVDAPYLAEREKDGLPVVAFDEVEARFPPSRHAMMVAIGYHDLNRARAGRCAAAKAKGYRLLAHVGGDARAVDPGAVGENCFVMDARSLQPGVRIGADCFVFDGARLGHHTRVGDHCWIASGAAVGGASTIGDFCFLGLNATVGHEVRIGELCFLGAGALVTKSAAPRSVFVARDTDLFRLDSEQFLRLTKLR